MSDKKMDFAQSIRELEEINKWFQDDDIDLDAGLKKLRKGKDLIRACRSRLKEVENEFIEIKQEFESEEHKPEAAPQTSTDSDDDIPF